MANSKLILPSDLSQRIFVIRGQKVMLDFHLAELYGVETRALIQAVKRNIRRFPSEFMFQLTPAEANILRSQSVISSGRHGGRRYTAYAFTEHGVAMLSSVLKSERAIAINVEIIKTFVRIREMLSSHKELASKLSDLERRIGKHDEHIDTLFEAIRQ